MSNIIHPTAVISPEVKLGDHIVIGAYAVIEGEVSLGNHVEIGTHATVCGWTTIGDGNRIFPYAAIGSDPQDKKYKRGDKTCLQIGDNNVFREFVTMNRGTTEGGGLTKIGDRNLFMAYAHVAHDCIVGNDNVFANVATLAGHVTVENRVIIGGLAAVHQFVRLGEMGMIGGCSRVTQDVPPYSLCNGNPALIYGVNSIGLRRAEVSAPNIKVIKSAFRIFFNSGLSRPTAIDRVENEVELTDEVRHLVKFVSGSERGLCGSVKNGTDTDE